MVRRCNVQARKTRDAKYVVWLGALLVAGGLLALVGYSAYYFATSFFGSRDVPVVVQGAVAALHAGILVLILAALIDRWRQRRRESFEEVEF